MYSQINTYDTFGHIFIINWSVSLHSQLQDNKTTSIPPHLSLHPISRYLSPMEQDKSASLSVLLYYDNWSVAGFVVLRTAISLSGQHNRTHKLPHATAAGLFRVHGNCWLSRAQLQQQIDRLSPRGCFSISATHRSVCLYPGLEQLLSITWQKKSSYKKLLRANARQHCSYTLNWVFVAEQTGIKKICVFALFFYG